MNTLQHVFDKIEAEQDASIRRSNKSTFYTLINYLEASRKGITKRDMGNFLNGNKFSEIFQELLDKSIIEQNQEGNYLLNADVKAHLSPILKELTSMVYKETYTPKTSIKDPTLELLYNCRSEIFSS
jgi:hypothetical protein